MAWVGLGLCAQGVAAAVSGGGWVGLGWVGLAWVGLGWLCTKCAHEIKRKCAQARFGQSVGDGLSPAAASTKGIALNLCCGRV